MNIFVTKIFRGNVNKYTRVFDIFASEIKKKIELAYNQPLGLYMIGYGTGKNILKLPPY